MKHYLSTFAGSAICGGFAFGIWPELWKTYGLMGGWLAACGNRLSKEEDAV